MEFLHYFPGEEVFHKKLYNDFTSWPSIYAIKLIKNNFLHTKNQTGHSSFHCATDDFGSLAGGPERQNHTRTVVEKQCSFLFTEVFLRVI